MTDEAKFTPSAAALLLESDLVDTITLLRDHRRGDDHLQRDIEEFAEAEAYERDPLRSRMVEGDRLQDAFGVAEAFSS